jgi:hypothetical protein
MPDKAPLYPVTRAHLDVLTDDVAIMQHAVGSQPDPAHGYCTDDVARALQVDLLHQHELGWDAVAASAWRNLTFLDEAFDQGSGRFRNFRRIDGSWLDETASEDSQGRAMLALGSTVALAPDASMVDTASSLFSLALPAMRHAKALRAQASVLLGCDAVMRGAPSGSTALAYRLLAKRLGSRLQPRASSEWPWPESRVTYENALLPQSLIVAAGFLGSRPMLEDGLKILDWLVASQTAPAGHLSTIGNGWWRRGGTKSRFDQQPIEATALLLAAAAAYEATADDKYRAVMELGYGWFLGANDLGVPIAVAERGACYDGLTPDGVNLNQGAESTLMWLIASEWIRALRAGRAGHETRTPRLASSAAR